MATYPTSDASSPAVVKVTNQLTTVASASFTPPLGHSIVVGITSDADNNTGATPTIANSGTALTWTRVDSTGHGSAGDVGLVALFTAKVTTSSAMVVTVTHGLNGQTSNKPKMLVVRVYSPSVVDPDSPVGTVVKGAFAASSTSIQAALSPLSTGGGLRGLWLDWNATGQPTAFLPNNTATEIVDAYHNAGLSTNVQIGKSTSTTAGAVETIGATLLSTSSDGNYIFYELRGPGIEPGPAFADTVFDATAFYTSDTAPAPTGSGTGSVAFTGSASGKRSPKSSATGTVTLTGSASGKRTPKANATGSLSFVGSAVGDAPSPPPSTGSGTGSLAFAGAASGKRVAKASSSGTVTFTGSASGRTVRRGTGSGTLAFAGTAVGKRTPKSSGNGTLAFVGTSAGKRIPKATGSSGLTFTGSALGNAPTVGASEGFASGSLAFTGTATGKRTPKGGAISSIALAGSAVGKRTPKASGSSSLTLIGMANGTRHPAANAAGSLTFAGTAAGTSSIAAPVDLTTLAIAGITQPPLHMAAVANTGPQVAAIPPPKFTIQPAT